MFKSIQLQTMLALQAGMNAKINLNWASAGNSWTRAILVETSESLEHHGWKWWKKQIPNMAQVQLEQVDVWHFALSHILEAYNCDSATAANEITKQLNEGITSVRFDEKIYHFSEMDLLEKLDLMAGLAAAKRFDIGLFASVLESCGMSGDELYRQYVGKNVLNFYRADNGYKAGTYTKIWNGREDNEHLVEIMNDLDSESTTFSDDVYACLQARYPGPTLADSPSPQ